MKIADISENNSGKKKVEFFNLGIYNFIKNKLNFRYVKVDGKGYYMQQTKEGFIRSNFSEMEQSFRYYIYENFEKLEINGKIDYHTFLEFYYHKSPIKNNNLLKKLLSEDFELSANELHNLKFETNYNYHNKILRQEMDAFISQENFIETKELFPLLLSKESKVFYKQFNKKSFFIIEYINWNKKKIAPTYDLFKIHVLNENELFKKTDYDDDLVTIKLSFNIKKDLGLYKEEKTATFNNHK